ncbi:MAG: fibronectin type III domain-containing protein [Chitinispirillaceae bacterium]
MKTVLGIISTVLVIVSCADYGLLNDNPPASVSLSIAGIQDSSVTLSWTQSTDVNFKTYKIYYDTTDNLSRFADSIVFAANTMHTIKNLNPATLYYFSVFVTDQAAKTSMSNIASTVTWLQFQPQQWVGDSAIMLKWGRPKGVSATGYRLFSNTTSSVDTLDSLKAQLASTDTSYSLFYLPYGTTRYYEVFAKGNNGYLTGSVTAQVNGWWFLQYPPVQVSDTSVTLSWAAVTNNVQQYVAFRSTSSPADSSKTPSGTFSASAVSGTVGGLVKGNRYFFKIYAKGVSGYIAWTQETSDSLQ